MTIKDYFSSLFKGTWSLLQGMQVTGKELVTPKVTKQYPENRSNLEIADRFRATLKFVYDAEGNHKCIACGLCQMNCPNGTIHIETKMVELPDGKKKRKLDKYMYDLGSCTFCQLCVLSCPHGAIEFSNDFEQAVFTRDKLVQQLNYLPEKETPGKYNCVFHNCNCNYRVLGTGSDLGQDFACGNLLVVRAVCNGRHLFPAGL